MKKYLNVKTAIACSFSISIILTGCSKEVDVQSPVTSSQISEMSQGLNGLVPDTSAVVDFFRTAFISQLNTTTKTASGEIVVFDFVERKRFMKGEANSLVLDYGDAQFYSRGWKYKITLDTTSNTILLSPNDKMKAEIVPGSFTTVVADFDLQTRTFNFITRFQELNGNKSEVAETIFKHF